MQKFADQNNHFLMKDYYCDVLCHLALDFTVIQNYSKFQQHSIL